MMPTLHPRSLGARSASSFGGSLKRRIRCRCRLCLPSRALGESEVPKPPNLRCDRAHSYINRCPLLQFRVSRYTAQRGTQTKKRRLSIACDTACEMMMMMTLDIGARTAHSDMYKLQICNEAAQTAPPALRTQSCHRIVNKDSSSYRNQSYLAHCHPS